MIWMMAGIRLISELPKGGPDESPEWLSEAWEKAFQTFSKKR
jgi:hypothetical protein